MDLLDTCPKCGSDYGSHDGTKCPAPKRISPPLDTAGAVFTTLAIKDIRPSPYNHRKRFVGLEELGDSIVAKGLVQPITVRRSPPPAKKGPKLADTPYELICGERRWRAADLRGVTHLPAIVRELSDVEVLEVQLVENIQRADVHPLEEALGFHDLMEKHGYTVEKIVEKTGKTRSWVYARLKLCNLVDEVREAFLADQITTQVALALARLPVVEHQAEALRGVLGLSGRDLDEVGVHPPQLSKPGDPYNSKPHALTNKQALAYLERRYMLDLKLAKFPLDDGSLVADVGDCLKCGYRTGNQPDLFSDVASADTCTRPPCFEAKTKAWWARAAADAKTRGLKVLPAKEAETLFSEYGGDKVISSASKYSEPDARLSWNNWNGNGEPPTWEKLLGKDLVAKVPRVLAQAPSGAPVELLDVDAALRLAKEAGKLKKPAREESRSSDNGEAARRRALEKRKAVVAIGIPRIASAVNAAFKADSVKESADWWRWLALGVIEQAGADDCHYAAAALKLEVKRTSASYDAPRRALMAEVKSAAATASTLRFVIAAVLISPSAAGTGWSPGYGKAFTAAAAQFKVDVARIGADVDADRKATEAARKKPAKVAKSKPAKAGGKAARK